MYEYSRWVQNLSHAAVGVTRGIVWPFDGLEGLHVEVSVGAVSQQMYNASETKYDCQDKSPRPLRCLAGRLKGIYLSVVLKRDDI